MFARDYRALAWERLRGNWGTAIGAYLIFSLLIGALSGTVIGALLLTGPLVVGLSAVMLTLIRTGSTKLDLLFDKLTDNFASKMVAYILQSLYLFLWSLLFLIPGIVKYYSYAMTFYLLRDHPELTATEAITRSRQLMNGHKWQLFCLDFSFIGWILLCSLTFGILSLWVVPYQAAARAAFYENIRAEYESEAAPAAPADGPVAI